jgi:uncharacterized protein (TIGR02722 family)
MQRLRWLSIAVLVVPSLVLLSCGPKTVQRIPEDSVTDLSGHWNDTDSRLVADEMIDDCLDDRWIDRHAASKDKRPTVIVGVVQNNSSEHIAVGTFIGDIERAFVGSGKVEMVASAEEREQVRGERADQQDNASQQTVKEWGKEHGADYIMGGSINTITDQDKGKAAVFYQVDLNLVNIETNEKVWLGQKKIKKLITHPKAKY